MSLYLKIIGNIHVIIGNIHVINNLTPFLEIHGVLTDTLLFTGATDCVYFNQTYATGETFPAGDDCNYW